MELCKTASCTGCGVCKAVCRHGAISFELDSLGFRYPMIDASKCVECGLCAQKCPSLNPAAIEPQNDCYLAWAKDDTIHYDSASGGISYLLGKHVIENGGFAVGCVWDKDFNAVMVVSDNIQDLGKTVGSKYVQSYIHDDAWAEVKTRLNTGQKGIFIGQPCQVAAMKSYSNNHSNLILCDLLCHGGCSPKCHHDHLEHIKQKKELKNITDIRFRGGGIIACIPYGMMTS